MPLTSSGQISLGDIASEKGDLPSDYSLGTESTANVNLNSVSKPDGNPPHAMSEFYLYDHNASGGGGGGPTLTQFQASDMAPDTFFACQLEETNIDYWHDGVGTYPLDLGDNVYTDAAGAGPAMPGWYKTATGTPYELDDGGSVITISLCGKSERRLKYNIKFIGESPMGIPMYHFNYKNEKDGVGRFVGTMVDDLQRLGFEDALIYGDDAIYVNYSKIDVPFELVK